MEGIKSKVHKLSNLKRENISSAKSKMPRFKKPNWLRVKLPVGQEYKKVRNIVDKYKLHTICESGN